jgi:hypothetical protein
MRRRRRCMSGKFKCAVGSAAAQRAMSQVFDPTCAGSTMRAPLLERCHRARSNDRREDEPLDRVSEAIFPVAARHGIHRPHLRAGKMLRPLRSNIAISLSPPSMTAEQPKASPPPVMRHYSPPVFRLLRVISFSGFFGRAICTVSPGASRRVSPLSRIVTGPVNAGSLATLSMSSVMST